MLPVTRSEGIKDITGAIKTFLCIKHLSKLKSRNINKLTNNTVNSTFIQQPGDEQGVPRQKHSTASNQDGK